jgi:MraZ protein
VIERFGGEWVHTVDGKGRVSVPAPFRPVLRAGHPGLDPESNPTVVLVHGIYDAACVQGYTVAGAERIGRIIDKMPRFSAKRRAFSQKFFGQQVTLEVDPNGRIILPKSLREKAGIAGKAVFVGDSDTFEIWSPEGYARKVQFADEVFAAETADSDPFEDFHAIEESLEL